MNTKYETIVFLIVSTVENVLIIGWIGYTSLFKLISSTLKLEQKLEDSLEVEVTFNF